ncbi:Lantibiotic biosynthesis dehydratase C-term [Bhargavaea ginsengi]|uniref:Lantibiotic biosynthesis dehydratase C-term n=1 Tax=Bhargavaea ginsengi TaxID=426757 RepID=A0A1H6ZR10_9BACL|nr:lantibiotic dehydratase C-terminal domain-containing protein [Bhargavaea ginsengi]SEJ52172.1 Lantibiotic biosynthesis dehydratase C-term [Bhargavaea ginsengi]
MHLEKEWHTYRFYPKYEYQLDEVVHQIVMPLASDLTGEVHYYYYLRREDHHGHHIMAGFRLTDDEAERLRYRIRHDCNMLLQAMEEEKPRRRRRQLPSENQSEQQPAVRPYKREPVFGENPAAGIVWPDLLLKCSTDIAFLVIENEILGGTDRATAVTLLMHQAIRSGLCSTDAAIGFLEKYAAHCIQACGDPDLAESLDRAVVMNEREFRSQWTRSLNNVHLLRTIRPFIEELASVRHQVEDQLVPSPPFEEFLFHYLHDTNNRLGISHEEEAYIAKLLHKSLEESSKYA